MLWLYTKFVLHTKRKLYKEGRRYAPVPISSSSNARWASTILWPPSRKDLIIWLRYIQFAMCNQMKAVLTKESPNSIDSSFDSMVNFLSHMEISAPSTNFHQEPESSIFWSVFVSSTKEGDSPHPISTPHNLSILILHDSWPKDVKKSSTMHRLLLKHIKQPTQKINLGFQNSGTTVIHQRLSDLPSTKQFHLPDISQTSLRNMFYCNSRTPIQMRKVWSLFVPAL